MKNVIGGQGGTVTVRNVEFLRFSDQTMAATPTGGLLVSGGTTNDTINGTAFAATMGGLGGHDTLNGLNDYDLLDGGSGNDSLNGGDDVLDGGAGEANELYGGTGNDYYVVNASDTIVAHDGDGAALVSPLLEDDAFVLPALEQGKGVDFEPLVLPGATEGDLDAGDKTGFEPQVLPSTPDGDL